MMIMPSNNSGVIVGYLAGKYPGRLGWLLSADGWRTPHSFLPYALDNGAFPAWRNKQPWNEAAFYRLLQLARMSAIKPMWVAVPDVVADRDATLASWAKHAPLIGMFGFPLAFVVQDGMTPGDVPEGAQIVFVGGSTEWKWRTLPIWTAHFPRVHVGRVNSQRMLWAAHEVGAESCDGTGWFRDPERPLGLIRYLDESTNGRKIHQPELF